MDRVGIARLATRGWRLVADRPRISALALGLLSATGFAPLGLWPLALLAMAGFVALLAATPSAARAAWLGWLFGFSHFTLGNNWIATAFTHQAEMPQALGWFAVPLLSLYLAIYPALAALGGRAIARRGLSWALVFAFAGCWTVSEMLRATVFSGYAWNPYAMVLLGPFDRPGLAALAPYLGTYALSGIAALLAGAAALLLVERRWASFALVAALVTAGMYAPARSSREGPLAFTLVQPDLRQAVLDDPYFYEPNFVRLAQLSRPREPGQRRIVLWPESGLADYLRPGYPQRYYDLTTALGDPDFARRRIGRAIGRGSLLFTGAADLEIAPDGFGGARAVGAYNAITAVAADGTIAGGYAKAHLVPYGEYLPMREILGPLGLNRLVPGTIDFIPGPGPRTLDFGAYGKAAMQICYEIVFAGEVVQRGTRPDYIFNPSNDGWFGAFGPPQHLAQARMRAIEEGLPVLRSTTTGISAVIDPYGTVLRHIPHHTAGRIDGQVPRALAPTPFARLGNVLSLCWAIVLLGAAAVALPRRRG
ncbi:MAG: apolipoprotein N-acyltransferase [Sphingomonadales bacterium 12-68-11]|nr:MAG: apolipoprotein N-acyltransferase [Sphingomonadales bacterium 12-68-11]